MATYTYAPMVAVNPEVQGSVIINGSGKLYAPEDVGFTTPLTVTLLNGTTTTTITTNARGLTQAFSLEDQASVIFKDDGPGGTAPIDSARGVIEEVLARTAEAEQHAAAAAQSAADVAAVQDAGVATILADAGSLSAGHVRRLAQLPNPYVEGVPLYSMGHSYTMYPYPYGTKYTGEAYMRVKNRLRMGDVFPMGRSGTIAIDNFGRMLSNEYDDGKGYWTPGSKGVCLIQNTINELGSGLVADAKFRNMWRMGIMGEIALMSSSATKDFTQASASNGTWAQHNTVEAEKGMNGLNYFSSTAGAYVEWTFTGPEVFYVGPVSDTYSLATFSVSVDGVNKTGTITPMGQKPSYTDAVTGIVHGYTQGIWRISGLSAGAHTLRMARVGAGNLFAGGIIQPATNPPRILVGKEPPRAGSGATGYNDNIAWYNAETEALVANWPHVYTVDLAANWDNSTMIASLDTGASFHPNDKGQAALADSWTAAINATVTDWIDGVVIL